MKKLTPGPSLEKRGEEEGIHPGPSVSKEGERKEGNENRRIIENWIKNWLAEELDLDLTISLLFYVFLGFFLAAGNRTLFSISL